MRKGSKMTEEQRKRCSQAHLGQKSWNKGMKGLQTAWNKGKEHLAVKGEQNPRWAGGVTRQESSAKYRRRNPEKVKQWRKDYHVRKKADPNYLLATNLRKTLLKKLGSKVNRESYVELLGCSVNELRFYLEGKFKEGMSWENHGLYGWHIDHEIPLFFFDLTNEEQRRSAFHYTNLQPLWAKENLIKGERINLKYERS